MLLFAIILIILNIRFDKKLCNRNFNLHPSSPQKSKCTFFNLSECIRALSLKISSELNGN